MGAICAQIIPLRQGREAWVPNLERNFSGAIVVSMGGAGSMRISMSLLSLLLLAGCATIVRGTEQNVAVDTVPSGAKVQFSNGQSCTSPCSITAKRNTAINVSVSMAGCTSQTAFVRPRITAGGGVLGGLPDLATGAIYDLEPSQLSFMLTCGESE
jgi:hypothetical protein